MLAAVALDSPISSKGSTATDAVSPWRGFAAGPAPDSSSRRASRSVRTRARSLVSAVGSLGEQPVHDAGEPSRMVRSQAGDRNVRLVANRRHQRVPRAHFEGASARRHLIEDDAKREEVAAIVHRVVVRETLRRHVVHGPGNDAAGRQIVRFRIVAVGNEVLGEPEIEKFDEPAVGQEDVSGRDVAMDDPLLVRHGKRVCHLRRHVEESCERERSVTEACLECRPPKQFHRDETLPRPFVDVEDRADVGMVERGREPRFALEPPDRIHILQETGRQELDRDSPGETRVLRFVDHAHAAASKRADDVEVRDLPADHRPASGPTGIVM